MDVFAFDFLMLFALQKTLFLQEQIRWAVLELKHIQQQSLKNGLSGDTFLKVREMICGNVYFYLPM